MKTNMKAIQNEIKDTVITSLLNKVISQDKLITFLRTECEIYKVNLLDTLKILLSKNMTQSHNKASTSVSSPRRKSIDNLNSVSLTQGLSSPGRHRATNSNDMSQSIDLIYKRSIDVQAGDMIKSLSSRNERMPIDNDSGKMPRELISQTNNNRLWNNQLKTISQSTIPINEKRSWSSAKNTMNKSNSLSISSKLRNKIDEKWSKEVHTPIKQRNNYNGLSNTSYHSKFNWKFNKK